MKKYRIYSLLLISLFLFTGWSNAADKIDFKEVVPGIPVKNTVTLVDLGAKTCIPCRMMAPILEELKAEYKSRAEVIFIDVWDEANEGKAQAFKVMSIPTQVFFDKQGREVYRHLGFLDKESIVAKLEELLKQ